MSDRYRILRDLGYSGIVRTYLVEDTHRFDETCVLKELLLPIQSVAKGQKPEEIFAQESKLLYQLQHPQIPNFREQFQVEKEGQKRLFLVQDYIQGQNYRYLLQNRLSQSNRFSEAEITNILRQILPILEYIQNKGVIHRDISPNNLILRSSDQLPVLVDFGFIKQIAIAIASTLPATPLSKFEYAPEEQIKKGVVFAHSDLYALAATMLVLLTGKEPPQLIEPKTLKWDWTKEITLSPQLTRVLKRMLENKPGDRFQSAREVMEALNQTEQQIRDHSLNQPLETQATVVIASSASEINSSATDPSMTSPASTIHKPLVGCLGKISLLLVLILGAGTMGWFAGKAWLNQMLQTENKSDLLTHPSSPSQSDRPTAGTSSEISDEEWKRKMDLRTRRLNLGINKKFFEALVDQIFVTQYPEQKGRSLTNKPEDKQWRDRRDTIAGQLLDKLNFLSPQARQGMGNYSQQQRDLWKQQVNQLRLSSRTLFDLADATFFYHFPEQENQPFVDQPIGQFWNAIVLDKLKSLQSGETYEKIGLSQNVSPTQMQGTLNPGEGKAYIAKFNQSQSIEIQLESDQDILLSIYTPTGKNNILEDSKLRQWSGVLSEEGVYEFVIVSQSTKPLKYQLNLTF